MRAQISRAAALIGVGLVLMTAPTCKSPSADAEAAPPSASSSAIPAVGRDAASPPPASTLPRADASAPDAEVDGSVPIPCTRKPVPAAGSFVADVDITIDATRGPHAAVLPLQVDRLLYGMNIADWQPEDYTPVPNADFVAYLGALRPGALRWPAGHRSQQYVWARGGADQSGDWELTPAHVDGFVSLAKSVGAEPVIGINVKRGTTAAAADLVRYLNVDHAYGVRFFYIGNEPDLTDGMTASPDAYADELIAFVDAMKAVDPSIRIIGPEMLTGAHVGGLHGTLDWMTPILVRGGSRIDGISWHYYPLDSGQANPASSAIVSIPHLFQETANDWNPAGLSFVDQVMPALATMRDAHAPGASIWITEIAEDPGPGAGAGLSDTVAAALWVGDVLGRYAEYRPGAIVRWIFKSDQAYALLGATNAPRPTYGATWLYARYFGDRIVDAQSTSITAVNVHAALHADGSLSVALVNKTSASQRVHVGVSGACISKAGQLTLEGTGLAATEFQINGQSLTPSVAQSGIAPAPAVGAQLFDVELPPASMRMMVYAP